HTLCIDRTRPRSARKIWIFLNTDMRRKDPLAERIDEERRLAIQRSAAGGLHEAAEQAAGERRLEQRRALARRELARPQPGKRAVRRVVADRFRRRQFGMEACR